MTTPEDLNLRFTLLWAVKKLLRENKAHNQREALFMCYSKSKAKNEPTGFEMRNFDSFYACYRMFKSRNKKK